MITTFHLPWLHQFLSLCVRVCVCAYNFTAAKGPAHAWHTHTYTERTEDMLKKCEQKKLNNTPVPSAAALLRETATTTTTQGGCKNNKSEPQERRAHACTCLPCLPCLSACCSRILCVHVCCITLLPVSALSRALCV